MLDYNIISQEICKKAPEFGFLDAKIANMVIDLEIQNNFTDWIKKNFHGDMEYLAKNTHIRFNPKLLHNNTLSIICVTIPYLTNQIVEHKKRLFEDNENLAYISSYALGRDYHKVVKKQLKLYAEWIRSFIEQLDLGFHYRVFTDSAPILEIELAKNSGLGWRGKNTLLINKKHGSIFFLGEIFTSLPLTTSINVDNTNHCGSCNKCLIACPTNAFIGPYKLDATKCISYLTIENKGYIPIQFRKQIGKRIYGCDDCQLVCPWNKFSKLSTLTDFATRHYLDKITLVEAFSWTEEEWKNKMQGSAIYRIGYYAWLRNVAIALGNSETSNAIISAIYQKVNHNSSLVAEHAKWALAQHISPR